MKIAIIEVGGSHDECIYSQIKIIKSLEGVHLTLICNNSLKENVQYFDLVDKKVFFQLRSGYKQWVDVYKLWRFCQKEGFDKIIFNTAHGSPVSRLLLFPFNKQTKFYGVLHQPKKVITSYTQKKISKKVAHYFILDEYLEKVVENGGKNKFSVSVFYPVFFNDYPQLEVKKNEGEVWIGVPGGVDLKRRDYKTLFESIKKYGINSNIRILLLGGFSQIPGSSIYLKKQLSELKVKDNFLIWEKFVPVETFHSMVKSCDYILPLIHDDHLSGSLYKNQISGAYNIAVAYKKPLLVEKTFGDKFLFDYNPITYRRESLMETINQLDENKSTNHYEHPKWSFEFQKKSYLNAIGITS